MVYHCHCLSLLKKVHWPDSNVGISAVIGSSKVQRWSYVTPVFKGSGNDTRLILPWQVIPISQIVLQVSLVPYTSCCISFHTHSLDVHIRVSTARLVHYFQGLFVQFAADWKAKESLEVLDGQCGVVVASIGGWYIVIMFEVLLKGSKRKMFKLITMPSNWLSLQAQNGQIRTMNKVDLHSNPLGMW